MATFQSLSDELKEAMKSGDTLRRDTLRMLQSALKNEAIEKRKQASEMTEEEVLSIVRRLVKQRKDSIEQYVAGGRADLAEQEEKELGILGAYLPASLPEAELEVLVREALGESGATSKADMGKAMGVVMKKVAGRADGNAVRAMVERLLV